MQALRIIHTEKEKFGKILFFLWDLNPFIFENHSSKALLYLRGLFITQTTGQSFLLLFRTQRGKVWNWCSALVTSRSLKKHLITPLWAVVKLWRVWQKPETGSVHLHSKSFALPLQPTHLNDAAFTLKGIFCVYGFSALTRKLNGKCLQRIFHGNYSQP